MINMLDETSDTASTTSSDVVADDLEQLWKEALEQCEQVEQLHSTILRDTDHLQQSLSENDDDIDHVMVTYKGVHQDFMDVLQSVHTNLLEYSSLNVGTTLLTMLESCEFKPSLH